MQEFFNDYVQSLETYIMFRIKETVAKITPELKAKNRAPIMLSMGAPTAAPPKALTESLKAALDEKGIHLYSSPKGEKFYRDAVAKRMKERFGVELNPDTEIFSLIGSKEGLANFIRVLINPTTKEEDKEIQSFPNYYYKSLKGQLLKGRGPSFFVPKNENIENTSSEEDEEGEEM